MLTRFLLFAVATSWMMPAISAAEKADAGPIRAVVTRAQSNITVDGNLEEFKHAICTPVEFFHPDYKNRAAQFFYLWDDEAFYVGLRTLDEKMFSPSARCGKAMRSSGISIPDGTTHS